MFPNITRDDLYSMDDRSLIWACIEPAMRQARARDTDTKTQVFSALNSGQRALFMFQVMYGHTQNGIAQFYDHIGYLIERLDFWTALKAGMKYFGDDTMLALVERMEQVFSVSELDLLSLEEEYRKALPETIRLIGAFIRSHADEFVRIAE